MSNSNKPQLLNLAHKPLNVKTANSFSLKEKKDYKMTF